MSKTNFRKKIFQALCAGSFILGVGVPVANAGLLQSIFGQHNSGQMQQQQPMASGGGSSYAMASGGSSFINDGDNKGYGYFPSHRPATGHHLFIFDPNFHAWGAYDGNGNLVNSGEATGGSNWCADLGRPCHSPTGTFHILNKQGPGCISHIFPLKTHGGAPMPWCMLFNSHGYAIHGTYEPIPDADVSHGCVRVQPSAARWLNQQFLQIGSPVIILPYR